jgi:hypothetical protein
MTVVRDALEREFELHEQHAGPTDRRPVGRGERPERAVGSRCDDDRVLAHDVDDDDGLAGRFVGAPHEFARNGVVVDGLRERIAVLVPPDRADEGRRRPGASRRDRLIEALASREFRRRRRQDRLPRPRDAFDREHDVPVRAAHHGDARTCARHASLPAEWLAIPPE